MLLAALLVASAAQAAPAPLPKPDRGPQTVARLHEELRSLGHEVIGLRPAGPPGWWVYSAWEWQAVLVNGRAELHACLRECRAEGADARAVLLAIRARLLAHDP
jgi:hypothetical protein